MIFKSKANKALDKMEDPRETLDYSYQRQLELLQKVRRGVADVATSRKRVELQINQLEGQATKLENQGRQALSAGREDLAREALNRRNGVNTQIADLRIDRDEIVAPGELGAVSREIEQANGLALRQTVGEGPDHVPDTALAQIASSMSGSSCEGG